MGNNKLLGVILIIAGIALAIYGNNLQNSFGYQFAGAFGRRDNSATIYIILGVVASIIGIVILMRKKSDNK